MSNIKLLDIEILLAFNCLLIYFANRKDLSLLATKNPFQNVDITKEAKSCT